MATDKVQDFLALIKKVDFMIKLVMTCLPPKVRKLAVLELERGLWLKSWGLSIVSNLSKIEFFPIEEASPSPSSYDIPTVFKPNNTTTTFAVHCKGDNTYCFGAGREAFEKAV